MGLSVFDSGGLSILGNYWKGATLDTSVAKGTWTASGTWTLPAHTLGGVLTLNGATAYIATKNSYAAADIIINMPLSTSTWILRPAGTSGSLQLFNDSVSANVIFAEGGGVTWSAMSHIGLVLGGNMTVTGYSFVGALDSDTSFKVSGTQVVGAQGAAVSDPAGGATVDAECRAVVATILDRMQAHGLIAT